MRWVMLGRVGMVEANNKDRYGCDPFISDVFSHCGFPRNCQSGSGRK